MHPSADELTRFVNKDLDKAAAERVGSHVRDCEFCTEFCENLRLFQDSVQAVGGEQLPPQAMELAERLYRQAVTGRIIPLVPLEEPGAVPTLLAADGRTEPEPQVQCLTTLCSENPEIVLRVMRDRVKNEDYLQLISDDPALSAHVMIQVPELGGEFITDDSGRAVLKKGLVETPDELTWQIRMPEAVFSLEPLVYDPDKTEYSKEVVLETERKDKVRVTFEGKTEGKQISIQVLQLDGRTDFEQVKVVVSQQNMSVQNDIKSNELTSFVMVDAEDEINIRLFQ